MLAVSPAVLFAQEKYTIKGKVGSVNPPSKIFLSYSADGKRVSDSTTIKNGVFQFSGEVKDITQATLLLDYKGIGIMNIDRKSKQDIVSLFLVNGTTNIISADSLSHAKVTGTKVNEDNVRYKAFVKSATDAEDALTAEYYAAPKEKRETKEFGDYIDKKDSVIGIQSKELNKQFIAANPDSYMSLQAIRGMGGPYPDPNELQPVFSKLSPSLQKNHGGCKIPDLLKHA